MSWDIYIQDLPAVGSMKEVPHDFVPRPIGLRGDLMRKVCEAAPDAEVEEKDWIFVQSDEVDISIQFHMEDRQQVRYLLVHVHGGSKSAACVATILAHLGLRALDTETGELFDRARIGTP